MGLMGNNLDVLAQPTTTVKTADKFAGTLFDPFKQFLGYIRLQEVSVSLFISSNHLIVLSDYVYNLDDYLDAGLHTSISTAL